MTGNAGRAVIFKSAALENLDRQMVVLSGVGAGEAVPGTEREREGRGHPPLPWGRPRHQRGDRVCGHAERSPQKSPSMGSHPAGGLGPLLQRDPHVAPFFLASLGSSSLFLLKRSCSVEISLSYDVV